MRATIAEHIAINAKLQEVCKSVDGIAVYDEGWDDSRVAAEVAPRLTKHHVIYVRKELGFGKLKIAAPKDFSTDVQELQAFVVQLVNSFERLTKQYTELSQRVKDIGDIVHRRNIQDQLDNVEPIRKV